MTSRSREFERWLAANAAFLAAAFASLSPVFQWLSIVVSAMVWLTLFVYAVIYFSGSRGRSSPAPKWLCRIVDAAALLALLLSESYVTSVAYLASMLLLAKMYATPLTYSPRSDSTDRNESIDAGLLHSGPWYFIVYRMLSRAAMLVLQLIPILAILALPIWLFFELIHPLTQANPIAHYQRIALGALQFSIVVGSIVGAIWAISMLAAKAPMVATALRYVGYAVIAFLLLGAVIRCTEDPTSTQCTPSRYIDC